MSTTTRPCWRLVVTGRLFSYNRQDRELEPQRRVLTAGYVGVRAVAPDAIGCKGYGMRLGRRQGLLSMGAAHG